MECNFESTENHDGGFTTTKCVAKAEVGGLCWHCAYKALQAENKRLRDTCSMINNSIFQDNDGEWQLSRPAELLKTIAEEALKDGNG